MLFVLSIRSEYASPVVEADFTLNPRLVSLYGYTPAPKRSRPVYGESDFTAYATHSAAC